MKKILVVCCAALVVCFLTSITTDSKSTLFRRRPVETVAVLMARRDLPPMTIITADCIETEKIPKAELPKGDRPFNGAEALGRVLMRSVVTGQILNESSFVPQGSSEELRAKIGPGMVAYTVHVSPGLPGKILVCPGCIVDVMFVSKLDPSRGFITVTTPLLSGAQVIAVGSSKNGRLAVTLEVNSRQAAALKLAMDKGDISLVVRNDQDNNGNKAARTYLSSPGAAAKIHADLPLGMVEVPKNASVSFDNSNHKRIIVGPDPKTTELPVGKYSIVSWTMEHRDKEGNRWSLRGRNLGEKGVFHIVEGETIKLSIGEPIVSSLRAHKVGSTYRIRHLLEGKMGETIQITKNGRRPAAPKLKISSPDCSYQEILTFKYG